MAATRSSRPRANSVDELARNLERAGRLDDLERELEALDASSLTEAERASWWELYGIAALRAGREDLATSRFEEGHRRHPGSGPLRSSLGQQYVKAHRIDRAFELFASCRFPDVPRDYVMMQARFAYLWDRYAAGREMLGPFYAGYRELRVLDDHYLYVRGLPFFGTWWSYLAAFCILCGDLKEIDDVTSWVARHCHDYDFDRLRLDLEAHREDRPERLVPLLEADLDKRLAGAMPAGYHQMNLAVARARTATSADDAEAILDRVRLSGRDFGWLEDVRALAKAEVAARFDRPDAERERVEAFLSRRPLLFEPDIALDFHLLRYQEKLKPRYRHG